MPVLVRSHPLPSSRIVHDRRAASSPLLSSSPPIERNDRGCVLTCARTVAEPRFIREFSLSLSLFLLFPFSSSTDSSSRTRTRLLLYTFSRIFGHEKKKKETILFFLFFKNSSRPLPRPTYRYIDEYKDDTYVSAAD